MKIIYTCVLNVAPQESQYIHGGLLNWNEPEEINLENILESGIEFSRYNYDI